MTATVGMRALRRTCRRIVWDVVRPFIVAVIKPDYKGKVTEEEVRSFLMKFADEGRIPKYGVPDKILFVDAIPKTSVGKISKVELRKAYR